ncbi:Cysteine protease atg4 [Terramyces sp. JEL0728]|nr:Cysteine protease atg4 [Terramyces sp. JEL0728]
MQDNLFKKFQDGLTFFMQKAKEQLSQMDSPRDLLRFVIHPSATSTGGELIFLGKKYPSIDIDFLEDFQTRIWLTYRDGFPPIEPNSYTCDSGWGCMLRSGQMMLVMALMYHEFGRDWRIYQIESGDWIRYAELVTKFIDSPTAVYSIHRIALEGKQFDKQVGEWFGPLTISHVLKVLVQEDKQSQLNIHVSQDSILYKKQVYNDIKDKSLLVLVSLRLGVEDLNPLYYPLIKACFSIKSCVGIAGGRPNSSLYFTGYQQNNLIYYDPHFKKQCVPIMDLNSYQKQDFYSYHCDRVLFLPINQMDPSMVVGFYCKDKAEVDQFFSDISAITSGSTPLFSVQEEPVSVVDEVISDDEF